MFCDQSCCCAPKMTDQALIARAVQLLRGGELVAFPTETVYGLGADAANPAAVAKIFAAKGRPTDHPLIVHLAAAAQLDDWARAVPSAARQLAAAFWPGPLTLILQRAAHVPDLVTGGQDTVGLRIPDQPLALALLRAFAGGIAAPSANRFGRISPTTADHVHAEFGAEAPLVLDGGPCRLGIESTIVDLSRGAPVILRPGAITAVDIGHILGELPAAAPGSDAPRVSGSLAAHYAPRTPLRLIDSDALAAEIRHHLATGLRLVVLARQPAPLVAAGLQWWQLSDDAGAYAHDLYAALRAADASSCHLILAEAPPRQPEWLAVSDRLQRAASGSTEEFEP
jgi:L-threonylcarbamoyladenylate synthase